MSLSRELLVRPGQTSPELTAQTPCFCGSGKTFINCCGSIELERDPPVGLFMFPNYLDAATVKDILDYVKKCPDEPMNVIDSKSTVENLSISNNPQRVTGRVDLGNKRQQITDIMRNTFIDLAKRCFDVELDWFEAPDIMRYRSGGFYKGHADSENYDKQSASWKKIIDRDLSLLIYLNDDFEGGELSFYTLRYQVWPRPGTAVMFPSDHRFVHQAETVNRGERYAIVSWASVKGMEKVAPQPPKNAIFV